MRIALFEPEIAGNAGAVLRLGACLGVAVDLIEPMGFAWDDARVRRTAMDYIDAVEITRHAGWDAFRAARPGRLVLLTTKGNASLYDAAFAPDDILLIGKESAAYPSRSPTSAPWRFESPSAAKCAHSTSPPQPRLP
jgi:tRNA (cytidine/uridine-2'-O-)-methyltransferase